MEEKDTEMYFVWGEDENGEFDAWEYLTAAQMMAVRNEYIMLGREFRSGKMSEIIEQTNQAG